MAAVRSLRSPFAVTLSVWRALFLREAAMRLARNPAEWFWVLAEPIGHIAILLWFFHVGFRTRHIAGADTSIFIMLGVLAVFLPRNLMMRSIGNVIRGDALYGYRQVKPVDIVIARAGLESLLWCVLFAIVWAGAMLFGLRISVPDPLGALLALGALWLVAMGLALTFSVIANLSAQVGHVVRMMMLPLYLLSAVIYPSVAIPVPMRETLLLNPLVHGVESLRVAFMPAYKIPPGIDLLYLVQFAVVLIFLGLALHAIFENFLEGEMIALEDVHKKYWTNRGEAIWALRGVSVTFPSRRSVAVIGANGAGKSTLLSLIAGIDRPTRGEIRCDRRVSWPIGLVSGLQSKLTGRQNTRFISRVQGFDDDELEEKIEFVIAYSELAEEFDKPVSTYSKGMRGRLNFALSVAFEFEVYLVDENMGGGGGTNFFMEKTRNTMKHLSEYTDLIVASHHERIVKSFCTSAVWLHEGKAHWFDSVDDAWREHAASLKALAAK